MSSLSANPTKRENNNHNIPGKPWEVIRADILTYNNINYFCIVDYDSKFPIVKRADDMYVESFILAGKVIFSEYGLPKR